MGATHFLFSGGDADFFLEHDTDNMHRDALDFYQEVLVPECGKEVFAHSAFLLYEFTCTH